MFPSLFKFIFATFKFVVGNSYYNNFVSSGYDRNINVAGGPHHAMREGLCELFTSLYDHKVVPCSIKLRTTAKMNPIPSEIDSARAALLQVAERLSTLQRNAQSRGTVRVFGLSPS